MYRSGNAVESEMQIINAEAEADIKLLNEFFATIVEANEPSILKEDSKEMLDKISGYNFEALDNDLQIITEDEFNLLSIKKGSLSPSERKEIESHVVHTQSFLNHIPWTKEFQNVPTIAGAHHEKLDGSGYPYGMTADQIPLPSKIMTVCDIFDALTASDRPYKPAMGLDRALDILRIESKQGYLDNDLVQIFIDAKVCKCIESKVYSSTNSATGTSNHPYAHDLHEHS